MVIIINYVSTHITSIVFTLVKIYICSLEYQYIFKITIIIVHDIRGLK